MFSNYSQRSPWRRVQVLHIQLLEVLLNLHCGSMCLVAEATVISAEASVDWFLVYCVLGIICQDQSTLAAAAAPTAATKHMEPASRDHITPVN